jgi:hypothetical protein
MASEPITIGEAPADKGSLVVLKCGDDGTLVKIFAEGAKSLDRRVLACLLTAMA